MTADRESSLFGKQRLQRANSAGLPYCLQVSVLVLLLLLILAPPSSWARHWARPDGNGGWRIADDTRPKAKLTLNSLTSATAIITYTANKINWVLSYDDPSGVGFNDATLGAERRATVLRVLRTISSHLNYTTGTINIEFEPSRQDGVGPLSDSGPIFSDLNPGYYNGAAYDHITNGEPPISPTEPDITLLLNFGYAFYSGTGTPANTEYDLETVLLHEITHGMGIISLVDIDGTSVFNHNRHGVFTVWDSLLKTTTNTPLFGSDGLFIGSPSNLAGSSPGIAFNGFYATHFNAGTSPIIYTPRPFQYGSSLTHWNPSMGSGSVMEPDVSAGVVKRDYTALDRAALLDLGWRVMGVNRVAAWTSYR